MRIERPPRWAIGLLVVLAAGNGGLLGYLALRPAPADPFAGRPVPAASAPEAATPAPTAPSPAPTPAEPDVPPVLAVYGDGYTAGSPLGGQGASGWPALVAEDLGADLRLAAVSMAGYAAVGTTGQSLPAIAADQPFPNAAVTIVFGSRNDYGSAVADVRAGAVETFDVIRSTAPESQLVVVGPAWSDAAVPADLFVLRDAVQEAALAADATFVDPLAEGWFSAPGPLISADGISPTDAGHAFMAEQIAPIAQDALPAL